jgi:hypothetical protein
MLLMSGSIKAPSQLGSNNMAEDKVAASCMDNMPIFRAENSEQMKKWT